MNNVELAESLFAAFKEGDADAVRGLCSRNLEARQNSGPPMNLAVLINFALAAHRVVHDFRYEDAVRSATATGFVEEHTVRGTLPDGSDFKLAVCVVADVEDGKVSCLREYFDSAGAMGLAKALA